MESNMKELAATVAKLATVNDKRAALIEQRDRLIAQQIEGGATWVQVQKITGLSPRGLALALKRSAG